MQDLSLKGMSSQMLAALCDINQTHLYCNTCIQRNHPSLLYISGEDLSTCKDEAFPHLEEQLLRNIISSVHVWA